MDEKKEARKKAVDSYMKYTGIAFQMGGIIFVGVLIGRKLDQYFEQEQPIFTAVLALLAVLGAIYSVIKDTLKK
ncbi:MAG: AtpZ/AtpI family protein [Bacteroidota bacterium]